MDDRPLTGPIDPDMKGRLRAPRANMPYARRPVGHHQGRVSDTLSPTNIARPHPESKPEPPPKLRPSATLKPRPGLPRQTRSEVLRRHMVQASSKKFRPPKRRRSIRPLGLAVAMIVVISSGTLVTANLITNNHPEGVLAGSVLSQTELDDGIDNNTPIETAPGKLADYEVDDALPRILTIERLGVEARVQAIGVGLNNVLKSPTNIYDVGWYKGSDKPGEDGTAVINGYISGPKSRGAFYGLNSLKKGDRLSIERGDGRILTYIVYSTELYENDKVDMARLMTTAVPKKSGLNLITTGGRYNITTNKFEDHIVVFAVSDE